MVITCASCLTKFNLDDSRIPAAGVKVRCSRCRHVFYVSPPAEAKGDPVQDFETFARQHEELMEPGHKRAEIPPPEERKEEEKWMPSEEEEKGEETFLFSEKKAHEERQEETPARETSRSKQFEPRRNLGRKRGPSLIFALIIALIIILLGAFYLYSEFDAGGRFSALLESPQKRIYGLWNQIWGTEKQGLVLGGLSGYEEKIGEIALFVIDGKVYNQSATAKRHIKVKVSIFDQNKAKIAEKEALCGNILSPADLKKMPPAFFEGEIIIQPQTPDDRVVEPGKGAPFIVAFRDPTGQAREFKVEIVEAPNL
jgi:predicted Zn finger-like uncharacterized protein